MLFSFGKYKREEIYVSRVVFGKPASLAGYNSRLSRQVDFLISRATRGIEKHAEGCVIGRGT